MITRPIVNIAELYAPCWDAYEYDVHKTNWTSSAPVVGRTISVSGWVRSSDLVRFHDGYRQLSAVSYKKYIDPFTGNPSDTNSIIDLKWFTQKLSYPISSSTYSNYLASGIYLPDGGWYRDKDASDDVSEEGTRVNWSNEEILRVDNGEVADNYGKITVYYTVDPNSQSSESMGRPKYPYTGWTIGSYTAPYY